ncbi:unnamed protein product [Prunus brigantina]
MKSSRDHFSTTLLTQKLILLQSLLFFGLMEGLVVHLFELELSVSMDLLSQVETFCSRMILVGTELSNPLLDFNPDLNSKAEYLSSHGLISDATFKIATSVCNYSQIYRQSVIQNAPLSPDSTAVNNQVHTEVSKFINNYDKLDVCIEDETYTYFNRPDVQDALHAWLIRVEK